MAPDAVYVVARRALLDALAALGAHRDCLVDKGTMTIAALEDGDDRAFSIAVAGPAALVVAKTHKIAGRRDEAKGRLKDKDALDVFRLMRAVDPPVFAAGFARLRQPIGRGLDAVGTERAREAVR